MPRSLGALAALIFMLVPSVVSCRRGAGLGRRAEEARPSRTTPPLAERAVPGRVERSGPAHVGRPAHGLVGGRREGPAGARVRCSLASARAENRWLGEGRPHRRSSLPRTARGRRSFRPIPLVPGDEPADLTWRECSNGIFSLPEEPDSCAGADTRPCGRVAPREDARRSRRGPEEPHASRGALRATRDRVRAADGRAFQGQPHDARGRTSPPAKKRGSSRHGIGPSRL